MLEAELEKAKMKSNAHMRNAARQKGACKNLELQQATLRNSVKTLKKQIQEKGEEHHAEQKALKRELREARGKNEALTLQVGNRDRQLQTVTSHHAALKKKRQTLKSNTSPHFWAAVEYLETCTRADARRFGERGGPNGSQ